MTQLNHKLIPKWVPILLIIIAVIGFADATYLTVEHYRNKIPPCTTSGCETVLTSAYATIGNIPLGLLGSLYYLTILILLIIYLDVKNEKALRTALYLTIVGFVVSVILFLLQALVIHAYCQYCLVSAGVCTLLFIISMYTFSKYRLSPQETLFS